MHKGLKVKRKRPKLIDKINSEINNSHKFTTLITSANYSTTTTTTTDSDRWS